MLCPTRLINRFDDDGLTKLLKDLERSLESAVPNFIPPVDIRKA